MSEITCGRCGLPASSHASGTSQSSMNVHPVECHLALQHRNTLELFEDLFAAINLVRLANAREIESYERGCQLGLDTIEGAARNLKSAGAPAMGVSLLDAAAQWIRNQMVRGVEEMRGSSNGDNEG